MLKVKVFNPQSNEAQIATLAPEPRREYFVGRSISCDVVLDSFDVSRTHGRIEFREGKYFYTDLGSANGSRINHAAVKAHESQWLKADDLIRIGDFVLLIEAIETAPPKPELPAKRTWTSGDLTVRCVRITDETADVKTFTFVAEPAVQFGYQPGQFVTLMLNINGEEVLRSYSISSAPTRPHTLEITVKRVPAPADAPDAPAGLVSNWLHDRLAVGQHIQLSGAFGKFTCFPNPASKLLLISAGSGITPLMSMARSLADTVSNADTIFFHCARTPNDIIFRAELELITARLPNFRLATSVTQTPPGQPWSGLRGRLTEAMLQTIAPDFRDRTVYVCGPAGFMQSVKTLLTALNFPAENYYEESFGSPPKQPAAPKMADANPAVSAPSAAQPIACFAQSNQEVAADGTESILELAEQAGVKIRSSCRQGVCGACRKQKLAGNVRYETEPDGLDESDRAAGFILTCVALPIDRVVVDA